MTSILVADLESEALAAFKLRRMLSVCPTWSERIGAQDEDLLGRIFLDEYPADGADLFPVAVIGHMGSTADFVAGGSQNVFRPNFTLDLSIWLKPLDEAACAWDQRLEIWNTFAKLYREMKDLAGADDADSEDGTSHLSIAEPTWVYMVPNPNKDRRANGLRYESVFNFRIGDA